MKAFFFTTALPTTLNPKNKNLYSRVMAFMKKGGKFINMERRNFLDRFISDMKVEMKEEPLESLDDSQPTGAAFQASRTCADRSALQCQGKATSQVWGC